MSRLSTLPIALVLGLGLAGTVSAGPPVAVLTDVQGAVTIQVEESGATETAARGMPLAQGDVLVTSDGARATVLFRNGNPLTVGAGQSETIGGGADDAAGGGGAVASLLSGGYSAGAMRQVGAVRAGDEEILEIVSPGRASLLTADNLQISWSMTLESVSLEILDADTDGLVWEASASGDAIAYAGPALEPGHSYLVVVSGDNKSAEVEFSVLAPERAAELQAGAAELETWISSLELAEGDVTPQLIRAGYWGSNEMPALAIPALEQAHQSAPEDEYLRNELMGAYLAVGRRASARALQPEEAETPTAE